MDNTSNSKHGIASPISNTKPISSNKNTIKSTNSTTTYDTSSIDTETLIESKKRMASPSKKNHYNLISNNYPQNQKITTTLTIMTPPLNIKTVITTITIVISFFIILAPTHAQTQDNIQVNVSILVDNNDVNILFQNGGNYKFTCPNNLTTTTTIGAHLDGICTDTLQVKDCTQAITEQADTIKTRLTNIETSCTTMNATDLTTTLTQVKTACDQANNKQDTTGVAISLSQCQQDLNKTSDNRWGERILFTILGALIHYGYGRYAREEIPRTITR